jgi:hypothetical protein
VFSNRVQLRLLKEDLAEKQRMEARAIWEAEAAQRAEAAFKRRAAQRQMQERQTMHEELRQVRHVRLRALYDADMLQYEQELNEMGLTLASQDF